MKTRMIWANFAVADLQKTNDFYTKLGFQSNQKHSSDDIASFLFGEQGFIINFFNKSKVNDDLNAAIGKWEKQSEIIFSLSADSKEEVDQWTQKVLDAGGKIFSEPQNYEQGYTFCFCDPDDHKFNVLYWPGM